MCPLRREMRGSRRAPGQERDVPGIRRCFNAERRAMPRTARRPDDVGAEQRHGRQRHRAPRHRDDATRYSCCSFIASFRRNIGTNDLHMMPVRTGYSGTHVCVTHVLTEFLTCRSINTAWAALEGVTCSENRPPDESKEAVRAAARPVPAPQPVAARSRLRPRGVVEARGRGASRVRGRRSGAGRCRGRLQRPAGLISSRR